MADRHMPSIFPECDQLKQVNEMLMVGKHEYFLDLPFFGKTGSIYDKCFTNFFQKFISPDYSPTNNLNPCQQLHESYRKCVEQHLEKTKLYDIDLDELRKEVLNTENDRLKSQQEKLSG